MIIKTIQNILVITILVLLTIGCADNGKVDKSEADSNLVLGLVIGQQQGVESGRASILSAVIEIEGSWEQFSCSSGSCGTTVSAKLFVKTDAGKTTGFYYQENPPTCYTSGGCTTAEFSQFTSFFPANREIVTFSNATKRMITRDKSGSKNYHIILWTTSENQVYICDVFNNKATQAEAETDLQSKIDGGTVSTDTTKLKTNGCNSFGWYLLKKY
jgi:hypothetical protein